MIFRHLFEMITYELGCKIARLIVAILKLELKQPSHKGTLLNLSIPKSTTSTEPKVLAML